MFWRRRQEQDLERELRAHLELEAEGCDRDAARRALGNLARIKEETREVWGYMWLDRLMQDVRYGWRALRSNPTFAAVAILAAALGIGASTSIFSVVYAVMLRPLPYDNPERLITPIFVRNGIIGSAMPDVQYEAWRKQAPIFDAAAAYMTSSSTATGFGDAEELRTAVVTPGFLKTLGVRLMIGRDFVDADAGQNGGLATIVSHGLWMRRYGGDWSVLSKTITLNGKQCSIVGVLPADFEFPNIRDVALLRAMPEPAAHAGGGTYFYPMIARLKPGITLKRAEADLDLIDQRLASSSPNIRRTIQRAQRVLVGLQQKLVGDVRPALLVVFAAVALVMLIVTVNICNLLLARAVARRREIAVRIALGANRARVIRQLLTEGLMLAILGGGAGIALAFGGVKLLRETVPPTVPHLAAIGINPAVLAFSAAVVIVAGTLFGLAPMRAISGGDPETALKQTVRSASAGRSRTEGMLIVAETAFALILLTGAGLLIRTFAALTSIPPGFDADHVVTASLTLPYWKYPKAERQSALIGEALERLRGGPGVVSVAAVGRLPYTGSMMISGVKIEGDPDPPNDDEGARVNFVAGDYFRTMGIPILQGRSPDGSDTPVGPQVAVVNEVFARRYFRGANPIGRRVKAQGVTDWLEIVGVCRNVKQGGLATLPAAEIFDSAPGGNATTLVIRTSKDPRTAISWLKAQLESIDRDMATPEIMTMKEVMAKLINSQIFVLRLLGLFAGVAIALVAIGIYSVLAYSVERRAREIGIRMALGAKAARIMMLIVGRAVQLATAGAAIGIACGWGLTRYLETLLYGVTPHDPATLIAGCAIVVVVAIGAAYIPARRAVGQGVTVTLREE